MCGEWNYLLWVVGLNLALSALHCFLSWLAPKTNNVWDNRLLKIIEYLQTLLEWVMAARRGKIK